MNRRALIVDDSKSARLFLHRMLQKYELIVDAVASAEEALDYLGFKRPDVIFLDHMMPGMDGFTAMRAIKRNPATATIPIVMFTAREGELYVSQARALGAVDVLPKELEPKALHALLERIGLLADGGEDKAPAPVGEEIVIADDTSLDSAMRGVDEQVLSDDLKRVLLRLFAEQRSRLRQDLAVSLEQLGYQSRDKPTRRPVLAMAASLLLALVLGAGAYHVLVQGEKQRLIAEHRQLEQRQAEEIHGLLQTNTQLRQRLAARDDDRRQSREAQWNTLLWGLNQDEEYHFGAPALDERRTRRIQEAVERLHAMGFRGELRLRLYRGDFCVQRDTTGAIHLAPGDTPWERCEFLSGLGLARDLDAESQTRWNQLAADGEEHSQGQIRLVLDLMGTETPRSPYPSPADTAGQWNRVAALNQRLEFQLRPQPTSITTSELSQTTGPAAW